MAQPPPLPGPLRPDAGRLLRRLLVAFGVAGVVLSVILARGGCAGGNGVSYGRFFTAPPASITRIVITPSDAPYTSPIGGPIVVTNPATIASVLSTLRPASEVKLNHPGSLWRYEIEIVDAAGSSFGTIESTSNQRMLLYTDSGSYATAQLGNLQPTAIAAPPVPTTGAAGTAPAGSGGAN